MDLKNQFKKFIKINGKYFLGIYGKKGLFLEKNKYTYIFDGGHFFKIEKNFVNIYKRFIKKNFYIKIFLVSKKFFIQKKIFDEKKLYLNLF